MKIIIWTLAAYLGAALIAFATIIWAERTNPTPPSLQITTRDKLKVALLWPRLLWTILVLIWERLRAK